VYLVIQVTPVSLQQSQPLASWQQPLLDWKRTHNRHFLAKDLNQQPLNTWPPTYVTGSLLIPKGSVDGVQHSELLNSVTFVHFMVFNYSKDHVSKTGSCFCPWMNGRTSTVLGPIQIANHGLPIVQ
jgi:hypothetical protein